MAAYSAATTRAWSCARRGRLAVFALLGMAITGLILFAAEASHVVLNRDLPVQGALIVLGLLNVAYFEFFVKSRVANLTSAQPLPRKPGSPELRH